MSNKVSVPSNSKKKKRPRNRLRWVLMGVYVCVWVCVCVSKLHLDRYFWRVPRGPSLCSSLSIEKRKQGKASASVPHLAGTIDFFFFFFPRTRIRAKKNMKKKYTLLFMSSIPTSSWRLVPLFVGVYTMGMPLCSMVRYGMVCVRYVSGIHVRVLCSLGTSRPMVARYLRDRSSSMRCRLFNRASMMVLFLFFSSFHRTNHCTSEIYSHFVTESTNWIFNYSSVFFQAPNCSFVSRIVPGKRERKGTRERPGWMDGIAVHCSVFVEKSQEAKWLVTSAALADMY